MKSKLLSFGFSCLGLFALIFVFHSLTAHAAFAGNHIIDDSTYNNASSMGPAAINAWLNANFPSSCISTNHGFSAPDPTGYSPGGGYTYGSSVSSGQIIYDAAQAYGLNPEVLLVTLQKEQSLVSGGGGCTVLGYTGATGYGCPDGGTTHNYSGINLYSTGTVFNGSYGVVTPGNIVSAVNGTCVSSAAQAGFSQQIIHAAWLLKFGQQRSLGNTSWDVQNTNFPEPGDSWNNSDDPLTCYGGPMTQGSFKRCSTDANPVYYDGYTTIDGVSTHMDTGATAALYWYTPHFAGNQNFYNLFVTWFGDPNTPCSATSNLSATPSGSKIMSYQYGDGITNLAYSQMNNTGSACAEVHLLNPGYQSWLTHVETGMKASSPSGGTLLAMRSPGNSHSGLVYVAYSGAGGAVEVHKFSPNMQTFPGYYDVATNLYNVSPATGTFITGDFLGRGYDQLAYILYNGNNGRVEIHLFDPTLQKAVGYYDVATNLSGVTPTSGMFVSGNFLGRNYDQLVYVLYSGSTGHVEIHMFDPTLQKAVGYYDVATNLSNVSPTNSTFVGGNFLGRGYDQLMYVIDNNGQNPSRVETHLFNPAMTQAVGYQDIVTTLGGFDPTQ